MTTSTFMTRPSAPLQVGRLSHRPWRFAPLLGALLLSACAAVGPNYDGPPKVEIGAGWSEPQAIAAQPADLAHWWRTLDDPVLDRLINAALAQNLELREAAARIDEARAWRDRAAGGNQPQAGVGASINRSQQSRNGPLPVGKIPGLNATQTIHDAGFDASWEADLFGAHRRALESANAKLQATEIEAQGVRMRVAAEVARDWFSTEGATREWQARQRQLEALRQTLALTRERVSAGDAPASDIDATQARYAAIDAALPEIDGRRRSAVLALGVLLGQPPESELALLDHAPPAHALLPLPVGQRADLLRRRPDVLAAERKLAASTADIGVATAELFPKLSIGASGGFQALNAGDWLSASSTRFSILPLISWRLFDGGRVRAEIQARETQQRQAALAYERSVLGALADAEQALTGYRAQLETLARQQSILDARRRSLEHAQARYAAGDIAKIELLTADDLVRESETAVARTHTTAAVQLVALYKSLGGGWDAPAPGEVTAAAVP